MLSFLITPALDPNPPLPLTRLQFETNLPDDLTVRVASLAGGGGQKIEAGRQPADTLKHMCGPDENTLAHGIRKIYDFLLRATEHDEVAKIEVVGQVDHKSINAVSFLGNEYQIGSVVHFVGCKDVSERELFAGKIDRFRLHTDPSTEADLHLKQKNITSLEQYKLKDRPEGLSKLPNDWTVEVGLRWLPDSMQNEQRQLSRSEDISWVRLDYVGAANDQLVSRPVSVDATFGQIVGEVQILHWSPKPLQINLANKPTAQTLIFAERASEMADILYSSDSDVHQALRHYLESSGQKADAKMYHYHVLRVKPPGYDERTQPPVARTTSVKLATAVGPAAFSLKWSNGAFTFREIPTCSLTMRPPTSSLEPHPAVQATIEHLTSCAPLPELHLEYFGAETPTYVWLTHSEAPQVVVPGAAMASCHVQIHDQNRRPITAMPFVSGEGEDLTMMRKIRLRRVQFVRKAGESDDCWVSIMGDGEGDSGFKSYNTWDFAKISARATQMATRDFGQDLTEAQSTFRVPMGFRHSDGAPDKTDSMLYPFENTCLEHKIEIVAVLHKKAAPNTQDLEARDTSGTWKPQSKWRAIVTVKPDTASAASVKLVLERTLRVSVQDPYFLGEPLPESLLLIMSDGYTINQTVGNLIAWPTSQLKEPRLDGRTDVDGLSKTVLRLVTDPKTQKQVPPKFAQLPHAQSVELLPSFDQPPSVMVMNGGMKVDGLRLEPFTEFRFSPDAPSMCDLTFSFDKRDDKLAVGRLAVLPGPPRTLMLTGADPEGKPVAGKAGVYDVSGVTIAVRDEFNQPTQRCRGQQLSGAAVVPLSMSVECATAPGQQLPAGFQLKLSPTAPCSFNNTECKADFRQDLCITAVGQVPQGGVMALLTFRVSQVRTCDPLEVRVRLPPPKDPHHFELCWHNVEIKPAQTASDSHISPLRPRRGDSGDASPAVPVPTFIIEAQPGADVSGLVLRVLTSAGVYLDEAKYTLGTSSLKSAEMLPTEKNKSFGAEVVHDYTARQVQAKTDLSARASEVCVCVISLRPKVMEESLSWGLGPLNQAALATGTRAPLTVGKV